MFVHLLPPVVEMLSNTGHRWNRQDENEVVSKITGEETQGLRCKTLAVILPARKGDINELLEDKQMTAKQEWLPLRGNHSIEIGYTTIEPYLWFELSYGDPRQRTADGGMRSSSPEKKPLRSWYKERSGQNRRAKRNEKWCAKSRLPSVRRSSIPSCAVLGALRWMDVLYGK